MIKTLDTEFQPLVERPTLRPSTTTVMTRLKANKAVTCNAAGDTSAQFLVTSKFCRDGSTSDSPFKRATRCYRARDLLNCAMAVDKISKYSLREVSADLPLRSQLELRACPCDGEDP
jgi:hypothetical protein